MPVIRINAIGDTFALHRSTRSLLGTLRRTHDTVAPVILMTHGYK
ncbi:hypothetical protein [Ruegeria sp. MALMAid1280]